MSNNIESHLDREPRFQAVQGVLQKGPHPEHGAVSRQMWEESIKKPDKFWAREAAELHWNQKWTKVLEWKEPYAKWFVGGKLNVSENCLDRHLDGAAEKQGGAHLGRRAGRKRVITYQQLHREVCRFANVLKRNKIKKGDRVIIYMPMIPEAADRHAGLRAPGHHALGGFRRVQRRIHQGPRADSGAVAVITADGGYRRGAIVPLKANVDAGAQGRRPSGSSA